MATDAGDALPGRDGQADDSEAPRRLGLLRPIVVVVLLVLSTFAWVSATNFTGFDEWLYLSLLSRGIVSFPQSDRPLQLVWDLPAVLLTPHGFGGFFVVHVLYLALAAVLVFLLVRRLAPEAPALAFLAGVFAATWAPLDMARLATVQASMNSGATFAALLALWLFVESDRAGRPALLALAVLAGLVTTRSYEAVLGLLAGAPLLLLGSSPPSRRRRWTWVALWETGVALAFALAAIPMLRSAASSYQREVLGLDLAPASVLGRLLLQLRLHVAPLVPAEPRELLHPAVAITAGLFLAGCLWLGRDAAGVTLPARRHLGVLALLGIAFAALGYAPFVVSASIVNATRMQFLSGFGIALLLAAVLGLAASVVPTRARRVLLAAGGAWVVAVGTGHTMGMQRAWDRASVYPAQRGTLAQLTGLAPGFQPDTLVLLVDDAGAWPASFGFRHAVQYLYGPGVTGHVAGRDDLLYSARATPAGILTIPTPAIRKPWGCAPALFRWDQIVAVRLAPDGMLSLIEDWNRSRLPPKPDGAPYAPRNRILHPASLPPQRAVLAASS